MVPINITYNAVCQNGKRMIILTGRVSEHNEKVSGSPVFILLTCIVRISKLRILTKFQIPCITYCTCVQKVIQVSHKSTIIP